MMFTGITYRTELATRMAHAANHLLRQIGPFALVGTLFGLLAPLLLRRISAMLRWLDRLAVRWQAGEDLTPHRRIAPHKPAPRDSRPAAPPPRLPAGHGWLIRLCQPASLAAGGFTYLIENDPETVALLKAAPHAARMIRPLYRMFGLVPPEHLRLPPRPPRIRPSRARPREPAPHKPTRPPSIFDVPARFHTKVPGLNAPRNKNWNT